MTYTRAIGVVFGKAIHWIVRGLALSKIHPNVLTALGLVINIGAAALLAVGQFRWAGAVIIGAGVFDMVDGRVARETNRVTRFGGFFDSVLDRYSDLALLVGLLVWYGSINRFGYVVLTAIVMTASVIDKMAPVLWVIAVLGNLTVIARMIFTWQETKRLEDAQLRPAGARAASKSS